MTSVNESIFFILVRGFFASNNKYALYPVFIMPVLSKPKTCALTPVAEFKALKFESPALTKSYNSLINDFPGIIAKLSESVPAIIGTFALCSISVVFEKTQHEDFRMLMGPYCSRLKNVTNGLIVSAPSLLR